MDANFEAMAGIEILVRYSQLCRKVEITADEVGPSLRWATAEVQKNERRSGGGSSGAPDGASSGAPSGAPSGQGEPPRQDYAPDEEPF